MEDKIKEIMESVFGISQADITDETSPDQVEQWDSLQHMNMVLAFEEEFNVELAGEEINKMMSFKDIKEILSQKAG